LENNTKISKSFIVFLITAVVIWFLITLSKVYTISISFPVKYSDLSQDKILQNEPLKEIDILVKSTGFNILSTRFLNQSIELNAGNLNKKSTFSYYFLIKNQKNKIQRQLRSGIEIQEISLDTIYLELGSLISKKVPLIPNLEIDYHIGYDLLDSEVIRPDSILISGPEAYVDQIDKIHLELLKLDDVKSDFSQKVKILRPENSNNLKVASEFATISGRVEKFTEGVFEIPYKVLNLPEGVDVTSLHKTVKVYFVVGLSDFNKIDKNFFQVVCDYTLSKENNLDYLVPKVIVKPAFIKSFKVVPNKIDFLIQK
jgi:YbbR domain-containing protein